MASDGQQGVSTAGQSDDELFDTGIHHIAVFPREVVDIQDARQDTKLLSRSDSRGHPIDGIDGRRDAGDGTSAPVEDTSDSLPTTQPLDEDDSVVTVVDDSIRSGESSVARQIDAHQGQTSTAPIQNKMNGVGDRTMSHRPGPSHCHHQNHHLHAHASSPPPLAPTSGTLVGSTTVSIHDAAEESAPPIASHSERQHNAFYAQPVPVASIDRESSLALSSSLAHSRRADASVATSTSASSQPDASAKPTASVMQVKDSMLSDGAVSASGAEQDSVQERALGSTYLADNSILNKSEKVHLETTGQAKKPPRERDTTTSPVHSLAAQQAGLIPPATKLPQHNKSGTPRHRHQDSSSTMQASSSTGYLAPSSGARRYVPSNAHRNASIAVSISADGIRELAVQPALSRSTQANKHHSESTHEPPAPAPFRASSSFDDTSSTAMSFDPSTAGAGYASFQEEKPMPKSKGKSKSHSGHDHDLDIPRRHVCRYCHKAFSQVTNLRVHERIHTGERPLACKFCSKSFAALASLVVHERSHTGERPYRCNQCDKSFKDASTRKRHMLVHLDPNDNAVPKFSCSFCGRTFNRKSNLKVHERIHTGTKPYICDICGKGFVARSGLAWHEKTHTEERTFTCRYCDKSFKGSSTLKKHERTHERHAEDDEDMHGYASSSIREPPPPQHLGFSQTVPYASMPPAPIPVGYVSAPNGFFAAPVGHMPSHPYYPTPHFIHRMPMSTAVSQTGYHVRTSDAMVVSAISGPSHHTHHSHHHQTATMAHGVPVTMAPLPAISAHTTSEAMMVGPHGPQASKQAQPSLDQP